MTDDGYPDGQPGAADPGPDRTRLVLGGGLAVVLLAVVGASGGWILAGDADPSTPPAATGTSAPASSGGTPTHAPPSTRPERSPTGTRTTTPAGLTVPDLVGTDFERARGALHDRKLGWRLVFGTGSGRNVERTSPAPGTAVRPGVTVTLWVAGPAPAVSVPDLLAQDCGDAANDLVAAGLYPRYRTGRRGPVTAQDPVPGSSARWNDQVALTCGDEPSTTTATPPPTP
ncbi:PASTA domain-containing protein [Micromonospora sp. DR5-3]|uniref:PASTA domain-containing protein n=1 Tax=unclassified Micromonospora TaxID=2617518 RepID=UPI0011D79EDB|nr:MULTISPECIES: PASTA domain-containing protein [unclassified Micromonospora]MCW3813776.1 PASTA domain-containing protein [Micromonospora sp. DR5-3]TYC25541.1 PASTA domain-containing protein [Micromonospora sp. MP36]